MLPKNARDAFRFSRREALLYDGAVAFFELTGLWRYPIRARGDLAEMTFRDKVYWLYKAQHPVRRARRGSGLEAHFARQRDHAWALPPGFEAEQEVTLSAVGDLMNHEYLANSEGSLYGGVADLIFGADVAMANLECVVMAHGPGQRELTMRSVPLTFDHHELDVARGLCGRGYAFMATACNHSLDFGAEGVDSTIRALKDRGIAFHGINARDEDAGAATIIDKNGIRLGLISHSFGLNAHEPPRDRPRIVNRTRLNGTPAEMDTRLLQEQLAHCRAEGVDFVVAQLHWGLEHEMYPRPEQVAVAHHLAELGVDAIIGHHPHVIQPVEWYRTRRDPLRVVPIYYSLGNLINPCSAPYLCRSLVAHMKLARGRSGMDSRVRTYVALAGASEVVQVADPIRRTISLKPAPAAS